MTRNWNTRYSKVAIPFLFLFMSSQGCERTRIDISQEGGSTEEIGQFHPGKPHTILYDDILIHVAADSFTKSVTIKGEKASAEKILRSKTDLGTHASHIKAGLTLETRETDDPSKIIESADADLEVCFLKDPSWDESKLIGIESNADNSVFRYITGEKLARVDDSICLSSRQATGTFFIAEENKDVSFRVAYTGEDYTAGDTLILECYAPSTEKILKDCYGTVTVEVKLSSGKVVSSEKTLQKGDNGALAFEDLAITEAGPVSISIVNAINQTTDLSIVVEPGAPHKVTSSFIPFTDDESQTTLVLSVEDKYGNPTTFPNENYTVIIRSADENLARTYTVSLDDRSKVIIDHLPLGTGPRDLEIEIPEIEITSEIQVEVPENYAAKSTDPPPAPSAFTVTFLSATQARLNWINGRYSTVGFTVAYQLSSLGSVDCATGSHITVHDLNNISHVIDTLEPSQSYSFCVCAINGAEPPDRSPCESLTIGRFNPGTAQTFHFDDVVVNIPANSFSESVTITGEKVSAEKILESEDALGAFFLDIKAGLTLETRNSDDSSIIVTASEDDVELCFPNDPSWDENTLSGIESSTEMNLFTYLSSDKLAIIGESQCLSTRHVSGILFLAEENTDVSFRVASSAEDFTAGDTLSIECYAPSTDDILNDCFGTVTVEVNLPSGTVVSSEKVFQAGDNGTLTFDDITITEAGPVSISILSAARQNTDLSIEVKPGSFHGLSTSFSTFTDDESKTILVLSMEDQYGNSIASSNENVSIVVRSADGSMVRSYTVSEDDASKVVIDDLPLDTGPQDLEVEIADIGFFAEIPTDVPENYAANITASPPSPSALKASIVSADQIQLSWISGGLSTVGFTVSYQAGFTAPPDCSSGTEVTVDDINNISHVIGGIDPFDTYSFRVCSLNGQQPAEASNGAIITLRRPGYEALSTSSVRLFWFYQLSPSGEVVISYLPGSTPPELCGDGTLVDQQVITGYSYEVSGLTWGESYSFKICSQEDAASMMANTGHSLLVDLSDEPATYNTTIIPGDSYVDFHVPFLNGITEGLIVRSTVAFPSPYCVDGTEVYQGSHFYFQDTSLSNDTTYYYRICGTDGSFMNPGETIETKPSDSHFHIFVEVSGLQGHELILENSNGEKLTVNHNGRHVFPTPLASSHEYSITVDSQPITPEQECQVLQGSNTIPNSSIWNVRVLCSEQSYLYVNTTNDMTLRVFTISDNGSLSSLQNISLPSGDLSTQGIGKNPHKPYLYVPTTSASSTPGNRMLTYYIGTDGLLTEESNVNGMGYLNIQDQRSYGVHGHYVFGTADNSHTLGVYRIAPDGRSILEGSRNTTTVNYWTRIPQPSLNGKRLYFRNSSENGLTISRILYTENPSNIIDTADRRKTVTSRYAASIFSQDPVTGRYLWSRANDRNYMYSFTVDPWTLDAAADPLTSPVKAGGISDMRMSVAHPSGNFLYSVDDNTVDLWTINRATGNLTHTTSYSINDPEADSDPQGKTLRYVVIHPNGAWLYTANFDDDSISVFHIDNQDGSLTFLEKKKVGNGPHSLVIVPR